MSSASLSAAAAQFHALDSAQHAPLITTTTTASTTANTSSTDSGAAAAVDMLASPLITGSRGAVPVSSPTMSKLPGLQYAIAHRRTDLRLPTFALPYDSVSTNSMDAPLSPTPSATESSLSLSSPSGPIEPSTATLHLSPTHCETPHFLPGVAPFGPETSPTDKATAVAALASIIADDDEHDELELERQRQRNKKGTRRGTLNPAAKNVLKAWMFSPEHFAHPYPSEEEKEELATEAGIEVKQLSNWFTNARKRLWQPVLRQSGVEVKNFLSTGRGGPRGNKLEVPPNLQQLVPPSPLTSPRASSAELSESPQKRAWSDVEATSLLLLDGADDMAMAAAAPPTKRKKTAARKKSASRKDGDGSSNDAAATIAHQLSHELRLALAERAAQTSATTSHEAPPTFQDLEILAAASLIGLHQQQYQPVH